MFQRTVLVLTLVVTHVAVTAAAELPTPAQRCEADVELASAKFAQCRLTAEARYSKSLDADKRAAALARCSEKLQQSFTKAVARYGLNCTSVPVAEFDFYLKQCSDDMVAASGLNGSLPTCGNGKIDVVGEQCDGSDLGEESCERLGLPGGVLRCDPDCRLDAAGCLVMPTPAVSSTPTPSPTTNPVAPVIEPDTASLRAAESRVFTVTNGIPPYTVNASGGTAVPTTVVARGGTFSYTKTQAGTFAVVVVDSDGLVGTAIVADPPTVATTTP